MGQYLLLEERVFVAAPDGCTTLPLAEGLERMSRDPDPVYAVWAGAGYPADGRSPVGWRSVRDNRHGGTGQVVILPEARVRAVFAAGMARRVRGALTYALTIRAWLAGQPEIQEETVLVAEKCGDTLLMALFDGPRVIEERVLPYPGPERGAEEINRSLRRVLSGTQGEVDWLCVVNDEALAAAAGEVLEGPERIRDVAGQPWQEGLSRSPDQLLFRPPQADSRQRMLVYWGRELLWHGVFLCGIAAAAWVLGGAHQEKTRLEENVRKALAQAQEDEESVSRLARQRYRSFLAAKGGPDLETMVADLLASLPPGWMLWRVRMDAESVVAEAVWDRNEDIPFRGIGIWAGATVRDMTTRGEAVKQVTARRGERRER